MKNNQIYFNINNKSYLNNYINQKEYNQNEKDYKNLPKKKIKLIL